MNNDVGIETLLGLTLARAEKTADDEIIFESDTGRKFKMYHNQDCCEGVSIDDIAGDLKDLLGTPITLAEESSNHEHPEGVPKPQYSDDSFTWTFYRLATIKGYVNIRWYGSSNGYYSESVDFIEIEK